MDFSFRSTQARGLSQYRFSQATSPAKSQRWVTDDNTVNEVGHAEDSRAGAAGYEYAQALRPLTICQVLKATRPHPDATFEVDGRKVYQVSLVAQVMALDIKATSGNKYQLDDSTGRRLIAMQWASLLPEGFEHLPNRGLDFMEFDYVRVLGTIDVFRDSRTFLVRKISKVNDPHEIFHHLLEVMVTNLRVERGAPPKSTQRPAVVPKAASASAPVVPRPRPPPPPTQIPNSPPPVYQFNYNLPFVPPPNAPETPQPVRRRTSSAGSSASQATPRYIAAQKGKGQASPEREASPPPLSSSEDEADGTDYFSTGSPSPAPSPPPSPPPPPRVAKSHSKQPRPSRGRDPLSNLTSLERDIYIEVQTKTTIARMYPSAPVGSARNSGKSRAKAMRGPEWVHWNEIIKSMVEIRGYSPNEFSPALDHLNSLGLIDIDQDPSHNGEGWLKIIG